MTITAADLFCGAGGTSTGVKLACAELNRPLGLTAINHWETAVATHAKNHPEARHLCASLDSLNPRSLYREDTLDLLWASPECTHHSRARGGKPVSDQSRATAWCAVRWAEALRPKIILVENVREFLDWGPIGANGQPLPSKKGELFRAWVKALEASGYRVEWRVLCAADYGDPTTRRRLFVQAVRGRRKITWPDPTHSPAEERDLISSRKPWVPARDIIDWSDPGKSIFTRKKPLAEKTMRRILAGLEKFGTAQPFILPQQAGGRPAHSVNEPISTIATAGAHALCQPYLIDVNHSGHDHRVYPICSPMKTVTGSRGVGLCNPYLIKFYGTGDAQPITDPLSTVTTKDRFGLCQPIVEFEGSRYTLDILFRMLKPAELAAAQGFPRGYQFAGNISEVTKQIGNAVPVGLAKALAKTAIQNL